MSNRYNYKNFVMAEEAPALMQFPEHRPRVGQKAPDHSLEDLDTGREIHLRDIWARETVILEFGSFT